MPDPTAMLQEFGNTLSGSKSRAANLANKTLTTLGSASLAT